MERGSRQHQFDEKAATARQRLRVPYYALLRRCFLPLSTRQAAILLYHSVGDDFNPLRVRFRDFERQMAYLAERFEVIGLRELLAWINGERAAPHKPLAVLTFDDGYLDNHELVKPLLLRLGLPATFYVTTSLLAGTSPPAWGPPLPMMNWEQVRALASDGFTVAAHTLTHPDLTRVSDAALDRELRDAKACLEAELRCPITDFAYPSGYFNDTVREHVRSAGYTTAVTTIPGTVRVGQDPLTLRRIGIGHFVGFDQFRAMLTRAISVPFLMRL